MHTHPHAQQRRVKKLVNHRVYIFNNAASSSQRKAQHHEPHTEPRDQPHTVDSLPKVCKDARLIKQQHQVVEARDVAVLWQDGQDGQHCVDVGVLEHQQTSVGTCTQRIIARHGSRNAMASQFVQRRHGNGELDRPLNSRSTN